MIRCVSFWFIVATLGNALASHESTVVDTVSTLSPKLKATVGLGNISLALEWREWLVLKEHATLNCTWGIVFPVQSLQLVGQPHVSSRQGQEVLTAYLQAPSLKFRYDTCVLRAKNDDVEYLRGTLDNTRIKIQLSTKKSTYGCFVTVEELELENFEVKYDYDINIVKTLENHKVLAQVSQLLQDDIKMNVNNEYGKIIGKSITIKRC